MCEKWYAYIPILVLRFVTSSNRCSSSDPRLTDNNAGMCDVTTVGLEFVTSETQSLRGDKSTDLDA